jgi:hypothetical protein
MAELVKDRRAVSAHNLLDSHKKLEILSAIAIHIAIRQIDEPEQSL